MVPRRIVHTQPHEPAEQKVELHSLHQLTFRANAVKGLKQHRPQQPFWRDRWTAKAGRVERRKLARQISQCRVGDPSDHPQRMIRPNPTLKIYVAEQRTRLLIRSTHHQLRLDPRSVNHFPPSATITFSTTC